ncbi:MAG: protein kinase, partial [Candidatus Cloacimonadaceae bacterium]|nr:protein kinase [Candidatus Cloacimonadaceae bacterium]
MNTFSSTHSYVIQNEICRTRYHVLYKAKNMVSGEFVTIKALEAKWLRNDEVRAELHKEASTSQNLNHPNICRTIAVFEEDYSIYKVQEYIEGKSLKAYLEEQRHSLSITFAIKIIRQILSALDYAHAQSVVHRNLNPDNILITDSDDIKIIGFGKPAIAWLKVESDRGIYHPAYYVSPEVYHGDTARASSDIYSVGVIAYALVCHRLPWSIEASNSILQQKQDSFKRPIQNPEFFGDKIPPWLFSIINKCLMVDKSLRIQSCAELISALQNERIYPFEPVTKIVEAKLPDDYQPPVSQLDQQVPEPEEASRPDPVAQVSAEPETEVWIEPEPENPPAFTSLIEDIAIRTPQESITDFDTYHTEQVTTDPSRSPVPTLPHEPEPEEITVSIPIPEPVNIPLPEPEMAPTPIPQRKSEPVYEQPLQPAKKFKIDQEDTGEEETMNHLKKVFTILMWLTLGVLVFIALKYYVFSDRPKIATP